MTAIRIRFGMALVFAALSFVFVSCGNSDQKENQSNNSVKKEKKKTVSSENFGTIKLTVSGDIEGDRAGVADFYHGNAGSTEWWEISGHDSPGGQTFSVDLKLMVIGQELAQPKAGTYQIGFVPNSPDVFTASFIDIIDSENHVQKEYGTMPGEGTLTIEVSNENRVKGHFEFTAHSLDDMMNIEDQIIVKGKFDAVNRMRNQKK